MTTGNRKVKVICIILSALIFAVAVCFAYYRMTRDGDRGHLEALSAIKDMLDESNRQSETESDTMLLPVPFYRLVIPADCTARFADAADDMAKKINLQTGVECQVITSGEDGLHVEGAIDILVGNIDREETKYAFEDMIIGDYVCRNVFGTVVIGGISEEETLIAAERFLTEVLPNADRYSLMVDGISFEHRVNREESKINLKLCGYDLDRYVLIYNAENSLESVYAKTVQGIIKNRCGILLDVHKRKPTDGIKEISISGDSGETCIKKNSEDVFVCGTDSYTLSSAVAQFCERLFKGNSTDFDIENQINIACQATDISVMNVLCDIKLSEAAVSDAVDTAKKIKNFLPDVCLFSAVEYGVYELIEAELKADLYTKLTIVDETKTGDKLIPLLYRNDVLNLTEIFVEEINGISVQTMNFVCINGGERYTVFAANGMSLAVCEKLKEKIQNSDGNDVFVIGYVGNDVQNSVNDGISVCWRQNIRIGSMNYTGEILTSYPKLQYTSADVYLCAGDKSCFISVTVSKRYSAEYLELISENT